MSGLEMTIAILVGGVLGAALGSFACCQTWRLYYKLNGKKKLGRRSVCLHCHKQLAWYENIPIVSWVVQKGRCRKCGKKIGVAELMAEVGGAVAFGLMGWKIGMEYGELMRKCGFGLKWLCGQNAEVTLMWVNVGIVVLFLVVAMILAIYDAKWRELPLSMLIVLNVVGTIYMIVNLIWGEFEILKVLEAVGVLAGVYYLLYFLSGEKLVGGGDWILCLAIAMMLGEPWLAIWVLFLSNLIGAVVMMPQKKKKIAFGPFLVAAFVVVYTFGGELLRLV